MHGTLGAVEKPEPTHPGRGEWYSPVTLEGCLSQTACELGQVGLPLLSALRVLVVLGQMTLPSSSQPPHRTSACGCTEPGTRLGD